MFNEHFIEAAFTLFGMCLVIIGLAGKRKVKLIQIEVGPIDSPWRRTLCTAMGLVILTAIGLVEMSGVPH